MRLRIAGLLTVAVLLVGGPASAAAGPSVTAERRGRTVVVWAKETAPRGRSLVVSIWHSRRAFTRGLAPARRCTFDYAGPANYACALRTRDDSHYTRVRFNGSLQFAAMLAT